MKSVSPLNPINGILLLNKSQGMTSNTALQKAKRLFGAQKAGHTGSLDPLATGMLPLCFGEATKVCQYLLDADKCYETTGLLGIKTSTADSMGEPIACHSDFSISHEQLTQVLDAYQGTIKQVPSMYSALKHKGRPLYHYARAGIEIDRDAREINIDALALTEFDGTQFSLVVSCSKGTYIRNLVEDIGDDLGIGAHVVRLHRVHTAGFEQFPMYSLEDIEKMSVSEKLSCLIPMDKAVDYLPRMTLTESEILTLRQGRVMDNNSVTDTGACIRLYDAEDGFIGIGEQLTQDTIKAKRLLAFESSL